MKCMHAMILEEFASVPRLDSTRLDLKPELLNRESNSQIHQHVPQTGGTGYVFNGIALCTYTTATSGISLQEISLSYAHPRFSRSYRTEIYIQEKPRVGVSAGDFAKQGEKKEEDKTEFSSVCMCVCLVL